MRGGDYGQQRGPILLWQQLLTILLYLFIPSHHVLTTTSVDRQRGNEGGELGTMTSVDNDWKWGGGSYGPLFINNKM